MSSPRDELALNPTGRLRRLRLLSLLFAVVASVPCAMAAVSDTSRFMEAYLVAWVFTLGLSMGCLGVLMLHRLTGGIWGVAITSSAERATALIPLLALAFVPIALELPRLYSWARPDV